MASAPSGSVRPPGPRVSIGIPVYNGERFLAASLESVLAQTYSDFEVIVSDNASTDSTPEIYRSFAARDSRVSFHRNATNLGAARNFNSVFARSRSQYFKWHAADDIASPQWLESCVEALDQTPAAAVAYAKTACVDEAGRHLYQFDDYVRLSGWPKDPVGRFQHFVGELYGNGIAAMPPVLGLMRADVLRSTRMLGNYSSADWVLDAEMLLRGEFVEVPQVLFSVRSHPGASSWRPTWSPHGDQQFYDPTVSGPWSAGLRTRWRDAELYVAVAQAPLGPGAKARLETWLTGLALRRWQRKLSPAVGRLVPLFMKPGGRR